MRPRGQWALDIGQPGPKLQARRTVRPLDARADRQRPSSSTRRAMRRAFPQPSRSPAWRRSHTHGHSRSPTTSSCRRRSVALASKRYRATTPRRTSPGTHTEIVRTGTARSDRRRRSSSGGQPDRRTGSRSARCGLGSIPTMLANRRASRRSNPRSRSASRATDTASRCKRARRVLDADRREFSSIDPFRRPAEHDFIEVTFRASSRQEVDIELSPATRSRRSPRSEKLADLIANVPRRFIARQRRRLDQARRARGRFQA